MKALEFPARKNAKPPARPSWLDGIAKETWESLAPEMARLGLLDEVTVVAFASLCTVAADARRLRDLALEPAQSSPGVLEAWLAAEKQLLEYFVEFLMTPASRARFAREGEGRS